MRGPARAGVLGMRHSAGRGRHHAAHQAIGMRAWVSDAVWLARQD
jgi:hypothetical protein